LPGATAREPGRRSRTKDENENEDDYARFRQSLRQSFALQGSGDQCSSALVGCCPDSARDKRAVGWNIQAMNNEVARITTTAGEMIVEFWSDVAPKTVENFKTLARKGFYDGTCFHRVIKGFMIQGGDPLTKDPNKEASWGTGDPGYKIKAEFNDRHHDRGVLSMARSNDPDSAGSQFFICHGTPRFLDRQYTAFGKLIKGDEVLEKIATAPTHAPDRPNQRIGVESIQIVPADSVK